MRSNTSIPADTFEVMVAGRDVCQAACSHPINMEATRRPSVVRLEAESTGEAYGWGLSAPTARRPKAGARVARFLDVWLLILRLQRAAQRGPSRF